MDAAESRLRALGCPKLDLQVRATNPEPIAFYEQVGFTIDDAGSLGKRLVPDDRPASVSTNVQAPDAQALSAESNR